MDSGPSKTLSNFLQCIIDWIGRSGVEVLYGNGISLSVRSNLSIVLSYVSRLGLDESDFRSRITSKFCLSEVWIRRFDPQNDQKIAEMVVSFIQDDLRELLKVPKIHQVPHKALKKNEFVAVFITFLLQLLSNVKTFLDEDRTTILVKELRFLLTILGDAPFQGTGVGNEEIQNLLIEFEVLANEIGSLVHSLIVATTDEDLKIIDEALCILLQHIDCLRAKIIELFELMPYVTPNGVAVDSLFIVNSVLNDIEDLMNQVDHLSVDVKAQLEILHQGLMLSMSMIKDVKGPRYLEIRELEEIVKRIIDLAYESEYLINNFVVGDIPLWYLAIRLPDFVKKIELSETDLCEFKKNYDIGALQLSEDLSAQVSWQPERTSDVNDIIVGFEDKVTDVLAKLVGGTKHLQIISILGMPGLGKTTLAKKLHNHPSVNYHFDYHLWCVVSQRYARRSLLIEIVIGLPSELDMSKIEKLEDESLGKHIYKILKGRRYLIVMDDIWDSSLWDDFRRFFPNDGNGSRILFSSRNKDVAPPNSIIYALPRLSNDQCWELLEKKVFHNKPCPQQLLALGKEIATKCCGLPLAVVVIAGSLSARKMDVNAWENVRRSVISHTFKGKNNSVTPILKLSYNHLPEHLKPCFLYIGTFIRYGRISVKLLKWLWIAEGFVRKEQNKSLESIAEEYVKELIDKSLITVAKIRSDGAPKTCLIHNLLRDLCLKIAEEENFFRISPDGYPIYGKHHRLHVYSKFSTKVDPAYLLTLGFQIRSFVNLGAHVHPSLYVHNMKLLRVLDVPSHKFNHGDGIELLVYLKYLAVSWLVLVGSLVNLEFLIVNNSKSEGVSTSSLTQKMEKLRYLRFTKACFDNDSSTSRTNNLECLINVHIKTLKDEEVLKFSPYLRKLKFLCKPLFDGEKRVRRYPDLRFLTQLESLNMTNFRRHHEMIELNIPSNIKKLTLSCMLLPWEKMSIIGGLLNLQVLKLRGNAFVGEKWDTRDGEFQQLIYLELAVLDIAQWTVESSEHFPKLQCLVLRNCQNLREIPREIGEIATLKLIEVVLCQKSVVESAREIQQEQDDMGNDELKVTTIDGDASEEYWRVNKEYLRMMLFPQDPALPTMEECSSDGPEI